MSSKLQTHQKVIIKDGKLCLIKEKYSDISNSKFEINKVCLNEQTFKIFYNNIFQECIKIYNNNYCNKSLFRLNQQHKKALLLTYNICNNSEKQKYIIFKELYNNFIEIDHNINIIIIFSYFQLYYRTCEINKVFSINNVSEYLDMKYLENYIEQNKIKEKYGVFLIEPNLSHIKNLFKEFKNKIYLIENEKKQEELFERAKKRVKFNK